MCKYQVRVNHTDVVLKETDNLNEAITEAQNFADIDSKFDEYEKGHYVVLDTTQDKVIAVR